MEAKTWKLDQTHSNIGFSIKHMMFTNVKGNFEDYQGEIKMEGTNLEKASLTFTAQVDSINTGNKDRDNHLKSPDFFDTAQFPTISFNSNSITHQKENEYLIQGDLNMHGISKPVVLNAEFSGLMQDPFGNTKIGLNINGKINRKDWGLNWNSTLETGGLLVGEDVKFDIEVQLV